MGRAVPLCRGHGATHGTERGPRHVPCNRREKGAVFHAVFSAFFGHYCSNLGSFLLSFTELSFTFWPYLTYLKVNEPFLTVFVGNSRYLATIVKIRPKSTENTKVATIARPTLGKGYSMLGHGHFSLPIIMFACRIFFPIISQ